MSKVLNLRALSVAVVLAGVVTGAGRLEATSSTGSSYTGATVPGRGAVADSVQLKLVRVAGNDARAVFGEAIETKVKVESSGKPAAGVAVTFTVVAGGGALADSVVMTGSDGTAATLWLPGTTVGEQRLQASVAGAEVEFTATVAAPEAGKSYFGRKKYVEYIPGELPIILSSPHAGNLRPEEIPDRTQGTRVRDNNVHDVVLRTAAALEELTGKRPHVVLMHLHRRKLDANREIGEAAQGRVYAEWAWHEYHGWIETARQLVTESHGRGFYIDMHGHGHEEQRLELGYLLSGRELTRSDEELNGERYVNKSSVRVLASQTEGGLAALLRGEQSFGEMMVRRGYRAVPSKSEPHPDGKPFFAGGYSTGRYGSRHGGMIDGLQIEHHREVRRTAEAREAYSRVLAETILEYLETHLGLQLRMQAQ